MSVGWGLECNEGVEVELWGECYNIEETTDLDLDYSGLIGEIPPEIGSLINLERIFLGNNQLFGTIPSELGNLTNLYFLDLSSNLLSGLIPESICNLEWNFSMIHNNQLCPPYPECIEGYVGYQDTSECEEPQPEVYLGFGELDIENQVVEIVMDVGETEGMWYGVTGIQFDITGGIIEDTFGGYIDNYFSVVSNSESTILIFGDYVINDISGILVNIEFNEFVDSELCITNWIISDEILNLIDDVNIGDCISLDCSILGDVNNDSSLNILDLVQISNLILDNGYDECGDTNSDGELNILDLVTLINVILDQP